MKTVTSLTPIPPPKTRDQVDLCQKRYCNSIRSSQGHHHYTGAVLQIVNLTQMGDILIAVWYQMNHFCIGYWECKSPQVKSFTIEERTNLSVRSEVQIWADYFVLLHRWSMNWYSNAVFSTWPIVTSVVTTWPKQLTDITLPTSYCFSPCIIDVTFPISYCCFSPPSKLWVLVLQTWEPSITLSQNLVP